MNSRFHPRMPRPMLSLLALVIVAAGLFSASVPTAQAQQTGSIRTLQAAYQRLMAFYIDPLPPDQILNEAWNGATAAAFAAGVDTVPSLAALPTDERGAWNAFAGPFADLVTASAGKV